MTFTALAYNEARQQDEQASVPDVIRAQAQAAASGQPSQAEEDKGMAMMGPVGRVTGPKGGA